MSILIVEDNPVNATLLTLMHDGRLAAVGLQPRALRVAADRQGLS